MTTEHLAEVIFRSSDPQDQRVGDIVSVVSSVPKMGGVACVVLGVPQHIGVERNHGRPGAARGPMEIRRSLYKLSASSMLDAILSGAMQLFDVGDIETTGKTLEQIHDELYDIVVDVISSGGIPIVLGGGHDIAWPTMHALITLRRQFGVVNIDAHADVRPLHDNVRAHSGSAFRQLLTIKNSGLVDKGLIEFGLQSVSVSAAHLKYVADNGGQVLMLDEIRDRGVFPSFRDAVDSIISSQMYVSLDMDAFASAYSPGVSAPSADGFTPAEIGQCLRHVGRQKNLAAFDVVEVNPDFDIDGRTSKLAGVMIMQLLSGVAERTKLHH
ncbi:MAG: formimidoylglutamase [Ignavibacteria bacterium]|nr:formimidoylglutamase [Ignavibacteria bacterium]